MSNFFKGKHILARKEDGKEMGVIKRDERRYKGKGGAKGDLREEEREKIERREMEEETARRDRGREKR